MKLAAIASVHNESFFLPYFVRHYEREVDRIFLLDNDTDDGSIEPFRNHPKVEISSYSTPHLLDQIKINKMLEKKAECLVEYSHVLFLDCDEHVVAKSRKPIKEVLAENPTRAVFGTDGRNIYTYEEPPLDPTKLFIEQRVHGIANAHYSKPILMRTSFQPDYVLGCHYLRNFDPPQVDPPERALFFLMHYRGVDEAHYLARSMETARRMDPTFITNWYHSKERESYKRKLDYERTAGRIERVLS